MNLVSHTLFALVLHPLQVSGVTLQKIQIHIQPTVNIFPVCGKPSWSEDEYCDDENNNADCNYDGGACCGLHVNKRFCIDCKCHQDISKDDVSEVRNFQFERSLESDDSNSEYLGKITSK